MDGIQSLIISSTKTYARQNVQQLRRMKSDEVRCSVYGEIVIGPADYHNQSSKFQSTGELWPDKKKLVR